MHVDKRRRELKAEQLSQMISKLELSGWAQVQEWYCSEGRSVMKEQPVQQASQPHDTSIANLDTTASSYLV